MFTANHDRLSDRVLHEVDQAGDSIVRNFGHGYLDDEWLFRNQLSDGEIECLDDPLRVVFVFNEHPIVRAHHPGEDEPLWTATFEDCLQPHYIGRYRESGRASTRIREITPDRLVVAWDDPYPRLEVRELGVGGDEG